MIDSRSYEEIRKAVSASIIDRRLLCVPLEAERIARLSGECAQTISRELATAGIKAGLNVEFGAPARAGIIPPATREDGPATHPSP